MDEETRAAFGRMDRYFELTQAQHQELRAEMQAGFGQLRAEFTAQRQQLRSEFRSFRDWVTREFAAVRAALQQLSLRIERLEKQRDPAP